MANTTSHSGPPVITITTDFGTQDAYVPAMKGAMLSICPDVRLVDVTHQISPQDVMEAGFVLQSALPYFPDDSIHLVVVDPGVGTERKAVALKIDDQWFVGPDNGIFPLVLNEEQPDLIVELDEPEYWRIGSPSTTFHGRDIFAPAAAHLAAGRSLKDIGSPVESLKPLRWAQPSVAPGIVQGWIVQVDHFGNCVTNIRKSTLAEAAELDVDCPTVDDFPSVKGFVGSTILRELSETYGAVPEGDPLLLFGSTGYLEIAVNQGNAAELLDIRKGDSVKFVYADSAE